ncbi:RsmE family RNA methyltransferase [Candidatus Protochlamydia phocaeensis]|uniref:RsmE family RNA methyltransferase n=1 Tax=Candidatus Protochlamydia phocaeensis TaxID=1414722 RepID=UPI000837D0C6|nr:16S rRNA (uracil(1498)-N(3))-methyltransferase [Candidatus Protochlamydia phocaeensis]
MPAERYFLEEELSLHARKILKDAEFHHLAHVMRTRKGEQVELVNGKGTLACASVQDILKDQAILIIEDIQTSHPPRPQAQLILAQALPKPDRLAFILEKGTELGVDEFWLFPGHLSGKKEFFPHQMERARALTIAAMKQCGRLDLPALIMKPALDKWDSLGGRAFFGDLDPQAPLFSQAWKSAAPLPPFIFFTGPESGWSQEEIALLKEKGAQGVKLHTNILRTDTASIAALSLMQHWLMEEGGLSP